MKRKILLISSVLLTLILITIVIFNNEDNSNNIISNITKEEPVINSNMITMMYETEAGSGEYIETKDNTWPESGYIFNENLSGCENGGELEYNLQNNTVNLLSNSSDRCYVYFDKYDGVWIDNVSITNVTGSSITLDVSATSENGSISKYYYALNNSEEYIESTTNPIVVNDLNKLTEYNIKIYAIDNTGAKSNIYELNVSTTDETGPVINGIEVSNITSNSLTVTINSDDANITRYYFSIDNGVNFSSSVNNYYTFTGLKYETLYDIVVYALSENKYESNELTVSATTLEATLEEFCNNSQNNNYISCWILFQFNGIQGNSGIYYHTNSLVNSASDNSYRYTWVAPNNYVCFGSDAATCPSNNLYRIIGLFDGKAKLIKATSYGNYYWSGSASNYDSTWKNSTLNKNVLNGTYLSSLGSTWSDKISIHNWKVGGLHYNNGYNANVQTTFNNEVGANSSTTNNTKIGLMYVSDYGYASPYSYWSTSLGSSSYKNAAENNWLYLEDDEWTITRGTSYSTQIAFYVEGNLGRTLANRVDYGSYVVRPTFYLNPDVIYSGGTATSTDPLRIKLN